MNTFFFKYCSLYKNWNEKNIYKWKHQQESGILKFILIEGIIKWGLIAEIALVGLTIFPGNIELKETILPLLFWFTASIIYSLALWRGTSLSYEENLNPNYFKT